jgi:tetratricopeptide (TPR) repeat protein
MFAHVANVLATKLPVNTSIHELQIYTYMFNTRSSGESTNSFLVMMRALVQQQYLKLQGSKAILPLLKAALGGRSQTHASCDELAKLFTQLTRIQHGPIYVMIDALDEAEEPTEIATWFRHLTTTSGSSLCVKVLATSRRLTNLEKLLKDAIIIAMEPACVDRDIDRFIPSCLVKISDAHCITDPSKLRLIHVALQKGHNGLFLWARLLAELLLSLPSEFHVMKSLDQLPVTLTSLYHQILAGLDAKLATNEPRRRIAQRTISWLCFTRSQVTLGALSEALAIESSDTRFHAEKMPTNAERLIREVLGAFVETLPHGSDDFIVQFVHLSVKEFFLDRGTPHNVADGSGISIYFPVLERANVEMATTLFRYLTFPTHGTLQPDLSIKTHNQLMPYASVWCCAHLRNSGQLGVDVLPLIRSLCDSESGVAWLDCTRTVNKDHGAHIVVLHAELKFWRRSFAKCDEWLDEIVPGVLRFARSQCKPDSAQSLKRAFQLTQFLELIGKREEPVKILEDCHLTLSRITNPSSAEVEVLVWSLTLQLGRMWALGGRPAQSLDLYDELLNRSATSNPEVRPVRTRLLEHGALIKRGMGGLNESESTYNKVCDDWTDLLGAEGIDTMRAFGGLATVYDMQGRLSESEDLQLRVLTTVEQLLSQSHVMYLQSLHDLGSVYEYRGKFAEAESSYQRCMSKRIEILGDQNTRTLSTMHNFALVYEAQGRIRDAKPMCEQVLQLRRKVLGDAHGDTGRAYNSVASIHLQTGNLAEAHACIIRAQDIKRSVLKTHSTTNDHPSMIVSANLMAGILLEQGNITEAWRISHELIASLTHILPSMTTLDRQTTHPSLMTAFHNAGIVKVGMGMYNDAQAFFQKAYDGRYLSLASDHPLTLRSLANLAWVIVKSSDGTPGSLAKAKNYYTTARISASSQLSSQLDHTLGIECFDKALFLHGECCVSRHIGLHDESKQLQDTLDGLTSVLTAELDHCLDGIHVKQALDQLKIEKDPIFDKRWERLRDIR